MTLGTQLVWLFTLGIPIACAAWTVTHEEVFRELREFALDRSQHAGQWPVRKFFYLFTCEYCFSHYVTIFFLWLTSFHLLLEDWRGYVIAWFALVWVANQYMSIHARLKLGIKAERVEVEVMEKHLEETADAQDGGHRRR